MKKTTQFVVVALALALPQTAFCWSDEGHAIVALMAQQILKNQSAQDPKAAQALATVQAVLGSTTIDKAALWPDQIKNISRGCVTPPYVKDPNWGNNPNKGKSSEICDAYSYTSSWHFIISDTSTYAIDQTRADYFKADAVIMSASLAHMLKGEPAPLLKGVSSFDNWKKMCLSKTNHECKKEALEFLIHFVGDIHQPLHAGSSCDLGANLQEVTFFGSENDPGAFWCAAKKPLDPTSAKEAKDYAICLHHELHQSWDQNILVRAPGSKYTAPGDYAALLMKDLASLSQSMDAKKCVTTAPGQDVKIDEPNGPLGWANESLCYQPQVYTFPDDGAAASRDRSAKDQKRTVAQAPPALIPNRCRADKVVKSLDDKGQVIVVHGVERVDYFTPFTIGPQYAAINIKTINERLYWGGVRLASLLKDIYGNGDKGAVLEAP